MKKRIPRRKLRNFIEDKGIKKGEVANALGISQQRFSYILNGRKRTLKDCCISDICALLDCDPEEVFYKNECDKYWKGSAQHIINKIEEN